MELAGDFLVSWYVWIVLFPLGLIWFNKCVVIFNFKANDWVGSYWTTLQTKLLKLKLIIILCNVMLIEVGIQFIGTQHINCYVIINKTFISNRLYESCFGAFIIYNKPWSCWFPWLWNLVIAT